MINVLNVNAYNEDNNMAEVSNIGDGDMITKQDIDDAVNAHNLSDTAHPDIREKMVTSVNNVIPVEGNVTISIPAEVTEETVSDWGFTKNTGTVTSVNNTSPVDGNVTLSIPTDTSDLTNGAGYLKNEASVPLALSISGTANSQYALSVFGTAKGQQSTAIGHGAYVDTGCVSSMAIGEIAYVTGNAKYAYQIGEGENTTSKTLSVGFGSTSGTPSTVLNYTLLDGTTGLIPDARISTNIARTSAIPTNTNQLTNGAGFITGINSSDVTTALGYTPYNATNPSGYITSSDLTDYQLIAQPVTTLSASGTVTLLDNTVNKITPTGNVTFSLPTVTDTTKFHQILVQLNLSTVYTITLGTTYYFNKTAPDLSATGVYNLIFEYDNANGYWVVGCVPKGAST